MFPTIINKDSSNIKSPNWYVAMTDKKEIFPVLVTDEGLEIPKTSINSKFSFDEKTWIITETFPEVVDGTVEWRQRQFAQLVTWQKMECFPDVNRIISTRNGYVGKTLLIDEKEYPLTILKRNDHVSANFSCNMGDRYVEVMFKDDEMFLGNSENGEWMQKTVVWKESLTL